MAGAAECGGHDKHGYSDVEDKERERLAKRGLAVGGREHGEELQRHIEHQGRA